MVVKNTGIEIGGRYGCSAYACCYRTVCAEIQYVGYLESCAGCKYCERHEIRKIIEGYDEKSVESIEGMKLIRVP
jgi:hypothetical protein